MDDRNDRPAALSGLRVLDLADDKGVLAGKLLADMGADVIKVEPPGGDPARLVGPFVGDVPHREGSLRFFHYNCNKKSITLNLETVRGQELLRRLVERSDVLLESFSPGSLDGLGLGYDALSEVNPRLIVASVTGFGQDGPDRDRKVSDIVGVATGGLLYVSGSPETPPVRPFGSQSYQLAGIYAAIGIMCALRARALTDRGQHVDVSIQESVVSILDTVHAFYDYGKQAVKREGTTHMLSVPCDVFQCEDGEVMLIGFNKALVDWMDEDGMAEGVKAPEYLYPSYRRQHRPEVHGAMRAWTRRHGKSEVFFGGQERHLPFGVVATPEDLMRNPQLAERGFFPEVEHPELGVTLKDLGAPYKFSRTPWRVSKRAPLVGEHNREVYDGELGLTTQQLDALERAGVI